MNLTRRKQQRARLVRIRDRQRDLAAAALAAERRALAAALQDHALAVQAISELPPGAMIRPVELEELGDAVEAMRLHVERVQARLNVRRQELRDAALAHERARVLYDRAALGHATAVQRAEQRDADDRPRPAVVVFDEEVAA